MKSGVDRIKEERSRQLIEEGYNPSHDRQHENGELALAAICYAAPTFIYAHSSRLYSEVYSDPWPWERGPWSDKRLRYGSNRNNPGNALPNPTEYTQEEKLDLLTKAGALIAAEIDRIQRSYIDEEGCSR